MPRAITAEAERTVLVFVGTLTAVAIVTFLICVAVLNRWVLRRVSQLSADLAHIEAESAYGPDGDPGPIPLDEPFVVAGEELMYPGDQDGSPENIINCHCIQIAVVNTQPDEE